MQKVTVRLPGELLEALQTTADESGLKLSDVMRKMLVGNLDKHLSNVRYLSEADLYQVTDVLTKLTAELTGVKNELNRIGINYNQIVKLQNIKNKYEKEVYELQNNPATGNALRLHELQTKYQRDVRLVEQNTVGIDPNVLQNINDVVNAVDGKLGDVLCVLLK